jgi:hypothetical protein
MAGTVRFRFATIPDSSPHFTTQEIQLQVEIILPLFRVSFVCRFRCWLDPWYLLACLSRDSHGSSFDNRSPSAGVPGYRISQMVANGGYVIDAYGFVNVISPAGIPMRSIVGIWPDPLMFVAINCADVKKSKEFYEQLGFVEQVRHLCSNIS